MAKEIDGYIKLQIRGGQANPAPPVGPALGAKGVVIMDFCKSFNDKTKDQMGKILPVVITVYKDKSFDFIIKTPPAASQLMEAAKIKKGSPQSNREKVGMVTWEQCLAIAEDKMADLNAFEVENAAMMIAGTARSMGLLVKGAPGGMTAAEIRKAEEKSEEATAQREADEAEAAAAEAGAPAEGEGGEVPAEGGGEAPAEGGGNDAPSEENQEG
jgi:large subunit ribosomal protein L11